MRLNYGYKLGLDGYIGQAQKLDHPICQKNTWIKTHWMQR